MLLLFLAPLLLPIGAWGKYDPSLHWKTLETPHFLVHYHEGEGEIAARAAGLAEEIHDRLVPRLKWQPRTRTHVVIADNWDVGNGWATSIPYNQITLSLTRPIGDRFGLTSYEDWIRLVLTHEYTHVLQLDMVHRLPRLLQRVLGRIYFPNFFQPQWLIEGLSTYEETELTAGGRGRSPAAEMVLRMAALEGRFPSPGGISVAPDAWPGGDSPYLFGESFLRFLADRYGREKLAELSLCYSGRSIPFLVDSTARRVFGKSYRLLWKEWQAGLRDRFERQAGELRKRGLTASTPVTHGGYFTSSPAWSPDGARLAYRVENADEYPGIRLANADGTGERKLIDSLSSYSAAGAGFAWAADGKGIYYTAWEVYRDFSAFNDLYFLDLQSGRDLRLTKGLRARDPAPSPNGARLLFIQNRLGKNRLALLDLNRKTSCPAGEDEVSPLSDFTDRQYANPRWSPDGTRIAVSVWQPGGFTDIWILDSEGRGVQEVSHDRAVDCAPAWSPDGSLVYFSSDRTGVFNLFAWDPRKKELKQVTNVLGGGFCPAPSPDGRRLAFSNYSSLGYDIHVMAVEPASWQPAAEYRDPYAASAHLEPKPLAAAPRDYEPWSTLYPRFWLPWGGYSRESGTMVGLFTMGTDVLARHTWYFTGLYGPSEGRLAYSFDYAYDGLRPTLAFHLSDLDVTHPDLLSEGSREEDYVERRKILDLSASLPFLSFASRHVVTLGYRREGLSALTDMEAETWYKGPPPAEGTLAGAHATYLFDNAKRYGYSISPEDGRSLRLSYRRDDPALGSDWTMDRYSADWQEYLGFSWRHHILKARGFLGVANGDVLPQRAFQLGGDSPGDILIPPDGETVFLRGYPPNSFRGQKAALLSLEYRFPVCNMDRGAGAGPLFFKRFHGAVFAEAGEAWDRDFEWSKVSKSVGTETRLDLVLAYWFEVTLRLGVAVGLDDEGETTLLFGLTLPY